MFIVGVNAHCAVMILIDVTICGIRIGIGVIVGILVGVGEINNIGVGVIVGVGGVHVIGKNGMIINWIVTINGRKAGEAVSAEFGRNVRRTI